MKKKVSILILLFLVGLIGIYSMPDLWATSSTSRIGGVEETWETSNRTFKLQIERRSEADGGILPGAYYVYKSAPENSHEWQTIFTQRRDDPNPISTTSARFIDSETAYVFFGSKYAVTADGGARWIVWDAEETVQKAQLKTAGLYPSIIDVKIDRNGRGEMRLQSLDGNAKNPAALKTTDFGVNWTLNN